ncbi:YlbG family protein [Fructilactobacillus carniphilus]|uniref:YlbG family protein n=1 Tax=Fructilactobacillus carniphilus TaxID=2940297 RepID=A0ABY5BWP8_9LACO|nr:YlbG family protein [Fructilactobacillus carniphilus]USS90924.1 YlbG family protein [Fructilactobacillus carniphilus]
MEKRTELLVSLFSVKQAKTLQRFGDVRYVSRRMRYAILYVKQADVNKIMRELNQLRMVKRVDVAPTQTLEFQFEDLNQTAEGAG